METISGVTIKGLKLTVGTRIYYTGDMANDAGFGVITHIESTAQWGSYLTIKMDDGRDIIKLQPCAFSPEYAGNGSTRFVTEEAYKTWYEARMKEMQERYKAVRS